MASPLESGPIGVRDDGFDDSGARTTIRIQTDWCGVCFDDASESLTVQDAHDDGPRLRAGELRDGGNADATDPKRHRDQEPVRLLGRRGKHLEPSERIRVIPGAMPWIQSIGDDVGGLAGTDQASNAVHGVAGRPGRDHRLIERRFAPNAIQTHPRQYPVVVAGQRSPPEFVCVAVEAETVPSANQGAAVHHCGGEVGAQMRASSRADA